MALGRVDRLLQVRARGRRGGGATCSAHCSCWSPPGVPYASHGSPSRSTSPGDSVVRGRFRGASDDGNPSSSQNICARVPSGQPSAGIVGELCSQPPLGVAESMFPNRSATSTWTVSPRVGSPAPISAPPSDDERRQAPEPRPQLAARVVADQQPPLVGVLAGEQPVERDLGVAVARVAVGERELRRLRQHVHELGLARAHATSISSSSAAAAGRPAPAPTPPSCTPSARGSRRSPAPRASRATRQGRRRSGARRSRARSGRSPPRRSPRSRRAGRARSRPRASRRAPRRAAAATSRRAHGSGTSAPACGGGQVQLGRARPLAQERFDVPDRRDDRGHDRVPVLGVADRVREHVLEPPRAEPLEEQQPAAERPGDARREQPGAGHQLVPERAEPLDRRRRGETPCAHSTSGSPSSAGQITAGRSPPGPFRCGSTTCSDEAGRTRRVERVPAALEHRHPGGRGEPVRRRDRAERAAQLRARRERHARNSAVSISSGARSSGRTRWQATRWPPPMSISGGSSSCRARRRLVRERAARAEAAARRRRERARDVALEHDARPRPLHDRVGHDGGREQRLRVRVLRRREQLLGRRRSRRSCRGT